MGRRRRTKVARRPRPKLPNIFDCPLCSKKALSITFEKEPNSFDIRCKNCGKTYHYNNPTRIPVKFGCPNCGDMAVTIEFIESTNSIRINCSSCGNSTFVSAREWELDGEKYSLVKLVPRGARLGCPKCSFRALIIHVTLQKDYAEIRCGACGFKKDFPVTPLDEKVDVYGQLIDWVRSDDFSEDQVEYTEVETFDEEEEALEATNLADSQEFGAEEKLSINSSSDSEEVSAESDSEIGDLSDWD
ncbi:MAG: hypothetical protein ACTSRS_10690 [Candidatus Helarchaeota archaeon]